MTLATRCPWCETVFRLGKEQAAVRAGMVRCGICGHTFNALDYLVRGTDLGGHAEKIMATRPSSRPAAPDLRVSEPMPPARAAPLRASDDDSIEITRIEGDRRATDGASDDLPVRDRRLAEPSFLRQARDDERPPMSALAMTGWIFLNLIVVLALVGQVAYFWRGQVFAVVPELASLLSQSCAAIGCEVEPPGDIDMITIESSSLEPKPNQPDVVTFSTLLRNHSPVAEHYPAIELTLTDSQDHPTVRRVLLPRDYLGSADAAHPERGLPGNSETPVKVPLEVSDAPVVGYRTRVFYP